MRNLFDLSGKVAIITGGSGALGGAMAESLIEAGVKIGILDLHEDRTLDRVKSLQALDGEAIDLVASVLDAQQLESARDKVLSHWGKVDILINAAGGNMKGATIGPDQTFLDLDLDDFRKVNDLNLTGTVLPIKVFAKTMADQEKGCIINISSMSAQRALTRVFGYSTAKAGIDILTKWLAVEMAHKFGEGIRINAIAPGFFIGEQNRRLLLNEDGSLTERGQTIIDQTPMKRFGKAEELLSTIHWLCSDASNFITGTIIPIDGGFSAYSGV